MYTVQYVCMYVIWVCPCRWAGASLCHHRLLCEHFKLTNYYVCTLTDTCTTRGHVQGETKPLTIESMYVCMCAAAVTT